MKKFLLAGVAALALGAAGSANAADLGRPVYKAPPPVAVPVPVRVFSWTGCYVGGNIGGAWGKKDFSSGAPNLFVFEEVPEPGLPPEVEANLFNVNSLLVSSGAFNDIHTSGFIGGGQIGCNYQFGVGKGLGGPGAWVIGFDGDFDWGNVKGDRSGSVTRTDVFTDDFRITTTTSATGTMHVKTDFLATATGRLGYAWDHWLFYGKGGVAVAHDKYNLTTTATETITCQPLTVVPCDETEFSKVANLFFDAKQRRVGWTAGAGIEWAFLDNWTAKVEWDWLDFGTKDISFALGPEEVATWSVKQRIMELKFGINYLFNWDSWGKGKGKAPVVARY